MFYTLRSQGFINSYFLDDSILFGETKAICKTNILVTGETLEELGFILNIPKSVTEPTQVMLHLGNIIDTVKMIVYLPEEKKENIKDLCRGLINEHVSTIRRVAKVIGTMVASFQATTFGKLHYRELEIQKIEALQRCKGDFDGIMTITPAMKKDLRYWIENIDLEIRYIQIKPADITIQTDSSLVGWACVYGDKIAQGRWSDAESKLHINVLELKAILFAISTYKTEFKYQHVRILTDSTTAVNYINNMGGVKSRQCNDEAKETWEICKENKIWISCAHIPGHENVADRPSREFKDDIEWTLDTTIFHRICAIWDLPSIDLFASRLNNQVNNYCSWHPDPFSTHVNAFSITWNKYRLVYAFPPFSVIGRVLQKLTEDQSRMILIVPDWATTPWFSILPSMMIDHPVRLPRMQRLLRRGQDLHPLRHHLKLIACLLSGNPSHSAGFRQQLKGLSWRPGVRVRKGNMMCMFANGPPFVQGNISIPYLRL